MRRRTLLSPFSMASLSSLLALAAGCGNTALPHGDGGSDGMIGNPDDGGAPTEPDMLTLLGGSQIIQGKYLLQTISDDDYAVLTSQANGGTIVAPIVGGGMPQTIDPAVDATPAVRGKVVFSWSGVNMATGAGDLVVWTAASGKAMKLASGSLQYRADASADGAYIVYTANLSQDGALVDVYLAKSDGSGAKALYTQVSARSPCTPFQGALAGSKFVLSHCPVAMPPATISVVDGATGMSTDIKTNAANFFAFDKSGTKVLVQDNDSKDSSVVSAGGGAGVTLENGIQAALFSPDGKDVIYIASDNAIKRTPASSSSPVTLTASGVKALGIPAVSPDGKYLVYTTKFNSNGQYSNLYLIPATAMGKALALSTSTNGAIFGDAFTADGKYLLYFTNCDKNFVGAYNALALGTGGDMPMPTVLGDKVWTNYATTGSKTVFNDHLKPATGTNTALAREDIYVTDVTKPSSIKLIATQADVNFYLNHAKDKVVYTFSAVAGMAGVYVAPIP